MDRVLMTAPAKRKRARGVTTWRCFVCGHTTTVWARAERHAHGEGHVRIELVVVLAGRRAAL